MNKKGYKKTLDKINDTLDIISTVETIIKLTQDNCLNKEIYSKYYNLSNENKILLSQERNNYINMLNLALEKLASLEYINNLIEEELTILE